MPSRETMIATAEAYARELGWTEAVSVDEGHTVRVLMCAPGASEQAVAAPLSKLRNALKQWGGPEIYPADEIYDLPEEEEAVAGESETVYVEQAETQEELDAALEAWAEAALAEIAAEEETEANARGELVEEWSVEDQVATVFDVPWESITEPALTPTGEMARELPDPEKEQAAARRALVGNVLADLEAEGLGYGLDEPAEDYDALHVGVAYDGIYGREPEDQHVGINGLHEDISPYGPTPKELYRALSGEGDTGPDGIPRPEQYVEPVVEPAKEETMCSGERNIIARKGSEVKVFGSQVKASVKARLEADGHKFYTVTKARAAELARGNGTVAIEASGKVTIVEENGRLRKSDGSELLVSLGDKSFQAKSVSVAYARAGWKIS